MGPTPKVFKPTLMTSEFDVTNDSLAIRPTIVALSTTREV